MFRISALLRVLGRTALILYFLIATLFIVFRYAILPNIDDWRPRIQAELSRALDTPIALGRIEAHWKGLHPHIELNDVAIFDGNGNPVLQLPSIRATLSWKGLHEGFPRFSYIEANGLSIEARRDAQQRIWILGKDIAAQSDHRSEVGLNHPAVQWLAQQPQVALRDSTIIWRDASRDASPLLLEKVTLGLRSRPGHHDFVLSATPPSLLGKHVEMRAAFDYVNPQLARIDPMAWEGTLYLTVEGMSPRHWQPWLDTPALMQSGSVSAKWWLTFAKAEPKRVAAQAQIGSGLWKLGEQSSLRAQKVDLFLDGPWQGYAANLEALQALLDAPYRSQTGLQEESTTSMVNASMSSAQPLNAAAILDGGLPVKVWVEASGLTLDLPEVFDHALGFERLELRGDLRRNAAQQLAAGFEDVRLVNHDFDLQLNGAWSEGGSGQAGLASLQGVFHWALLDGIDLYLPESVNLEAREWLINGLLDGQIEHATVKLEGDLGRFPFGDDSGRLHIDGAFRGGVIDYAPGPPDETGWPALKDVNGRILLDQVDLRLFADEAAVSPAPGHDIMLSNLTARIPNIERDSVLTIEGHTQAPAPAYLALAHHSPLRGLLDGFLDPARADGDWQVPLSLTIPLLEVNDTQVQGAVQFDGGMLALEPEAPPFQQMRGTLEFSETGFSVDGLQARFLEGAVAFSGGIGGVRTGLDMSGSIGAPALAKYVSVKGMERLQGVLAYTAQLRRRPSGRYALTAQSDLKGLAIDLPAPAGKEAGASSKLDVQWAPGSDKASMQLSVALGAHLRARLLRREGQHQGPYFQSGVIGTLMPDTLPSTGLLVDARYPDIDIDQWRAVVDEFSTPLADSAESARELFPLVQRTRLQADRMSLYGLELNTATLTAQRQKPLVWRMDVASAETAGTLFWSQAANSAGRVDAQFDRLSLGKVNHEQSAAAKDAGKATDKQDDGWESHLDIPEIDINVDKLRLYGRHVGALAVAGVSEQGGHFWRLNKLRLSGPSAQLQGTGIWRLSGPQRGLTIDADVNISNAGELLNQIEFKNFMKGGQGSLTGRFEWRNMPWRFKRSDLNGQLRLELENGTFSTLNSRSARLLELLSLQSLQRIASFNLNPGAIFKEGFSFDRITGTLHIENGVLTTNDYRVTSPAAAISIGGDVDLTNDKIDLQAMVVPNLDVSGATVAAGIAINPIVGLGAFVTQWLLKKPLSEAMTVHYDVSGDLNAPQLREINSPTPAGQMPGKDGIQGGALKLDNDAHGGLRELGELIP